MNKPNFMEEEIKYIHRHAKWFFDRIEDITNLHLSLADKSELLNYLGKSYHANQIDAIYLMLTYIFKKWDTSQKY